MDLELRLGSGAAFDTIQDTQSLQLSDQSQSESLDCFYAVSYPAPAPAMAGPSGTEKSKGPCLGFGGAKPISQDSRAQPESQQCEVAGKNVFGNKNHATIEDASQKSESSDSHDILPPFGSHNCSCPESSGTKVPEGFEAETASINQVQINQDVLGNENSGNNQNSPHQEHASVITPSKEFKGWMEGMMKIGSASQFQWPKWTVSYLLDSSDMDTLVTDYRIMNLANDLNDEDLRLFLEEQLRKETAGLSEDVIRRRLRTHICGSSTALTELGAMGVEPQQIMQAPARTPAKLGVSVATGTEKGKEPLVDFNSNEPRAKLMQVVAAGVEARGGAITGKRKIEEGESSSSPKWVKKIKAFGFWMSKMLATANSEEKEKGPSEDQDEKQKGVKKR